MIEPDYLETVAAGSGGGIGTDAAAGDLGAGGSDAGDRFGGGADVDPDDDDGDGGDAPAGARGVDFYHRCLFDPVFAAAAPVDPAGFASEPPPVRITGPGFSSNNGRDFAYNPPPSIVQDTPGSGGAAAVPAPFDVSISAAGGGGPTARFVPGAAANLVPENVLEDIAVPGGVVSYAYAEVTTDGKTPLSCQLRITATAPAPPAPTQNALPLLVPVLLHLIDYTAPVAPATVGTDTPYRVFFPATNIQLLAREIFRTSVADPVPGTLPYDPWYNWIICSYLADAAYVGA